MVVAKQVNPFAAALAGSSASPEITERPIAMSQFAQALQENNNNAGDADLASTFGNFDKKLNFDKPIGYDSPELQKKHEAEQENIRQHLARLTRKEEERQIFSATAKKEKAQIEALLANLGVKTPSKVAKAHPEIKIVTMQHHTAVSIEAGGGAGARSFVDNLGRTIQFWNAQLDTSRSSVWHNATTSKRASRLDQARGSHKTKLIHDAGHHENTTGE